ncbi:50S ribosomal protein L10 [Candidatus Woesearchaeota archaeon]|nr:50S ribosomal protein L10 [Candidatus Woesearchaeota archaeon]
MAEYKARAADYKKKVVDELVKLFKEYPIVGAVDVENLPAPQLQKMRAQLRDKVKILMTKRRLMNLAIDKVKDEKKGIEELLPYLKGMPALMFTKENPFAIYKTINKSKSPAPAKPGQTAPKDIVITAGPTPFAPGPVIGELGAIGLKTGVENGKVAIQQDKVVVKEGEEIKPNVASILSRLGIEPMEIGLNVTAMYEDGSIYERNILSVDEQEYIDNITKAHQWSFNLAVEAGIMNPETTEFMIIKAAADSKALAREADILTDETVGEVLGKAERQMQALKAELNIPEAPAEEKPAEDKKEESKPEEQTQEKEEKAEEQASEEKPAEDNKEEQAQESPKEGEEKKDEPEASKPEGDDQ